MAWRLHFFSSAVFQRDDCNVPGQRTFQTPNSREATQTFFFQACPNTWLHLSTYSWWSSIFRRKNQELEGICYHLKKYLSAISVFELITICCGLCLGLEFEHYALKLYVHLCDVYRFRLKKTLLQNADAARMTQQKNLDEQEQRSQVFFMRDSTFIFKMFFCYNLKFPPFQIFPS